MIAYKFLRAGRVGPFSQFRWPEPGAWVRARGDLDLCRSGIHACRTEHLPWWLADELWEAELSGEVRTEEHKLVAPAGRLLRQIQEWTEDRATEFAEACAWRARDLAVEALTRAGHGDASDRLASYESLADVQVEARQIAEAVPDTRISLTIAADGAVRALAGTAATSAYIAAHAALRLAGPAAYEAERAWQARWLVERLGLDAAA
jgi:hypothetical protein